MIDLAPELDDLGWCPFASATGKPCILCGGTRASLALLRGDLSHAIEMNAFVVALALAASLTLTWKLVAGTLTLPSMSMLKADIPSRYISSILILASLGWVWNVVRWM